MKKPTQVFESNQTTHSRYLFSIFLRFLQGEDEGGNVYELHPDGNSFDFFQGLIKKKIQSASSSSGLQRDSRKTYSIVCYEINPFLVFGMNWDRVHLEMGTKSKGLGYITTTICLFTRCLQKYKIHWICPILVEIGQSKN